MYYLSPQQIESLRSHVELGNINVQKHVSSDLYIYNYSKQFQYNPAWDEITLMSRGLILDSNYQIISRPFPKFFNMEELDGKIEETADDVRPFKVYPKMDGSLGIAYVDDTGSVCVATRGSFTGHQALWATNHIQKNEELCKHIREGHKEITYLFEIIYPENRIVLNYGNREDMVLLSISSNNLVWEHCCLNEHNRKLFSGIGVNVVKPVSSGMGNIHSGAFSRLKGEDKDGEEGYVVHFDGGQVTRMKIKFENYVIKHKLISNLSEKSIWENLMNGVSKEDIIAPLPDEWYEWTEEVIDNFQNEYDSIEVVAYNLFYTDRPDGEIQDREYRKEFAKWASGTPYTSLLFMILDGKDISKAIWKMLNPKDKEDNNEIV